MVKTGYGCQGSRIRVYIPEAETWRRTRRIMSTSMVNASQV
ncbi:rCG22929, partial [Rattus norvegicus]